ncbi:MAG: SpoIIE family protein phosphatase [Bacteroidaceae bacterium]|nr:SpoIIE family protein phosphatase [Bacteroidaceae bacterium]
MEELNSKSWLKSLQSKSSLAILITAAVLIELTAAIQYWYARKGIREEVEQRAKSELKVVNLEIQNIMTAVEVAVKNHAWEAEQMLAQPDSMYGVLHRLAEQNEQIIGAGITFTPNYYATKGYWFEPYVRAEKGKPAVASQIGGENHDYTQSEFFSVPMKSGKPYWSEPYLDKDGAHDIVTTYGYPLRDKTGRVVAILGADVSLDWLDGLINASHIYPSSYNMMISRKGQLMVCPEESLVMRRTIQDVTAGMKDTTVRSINQNMMNGVSGQTSVVDDKGEKNYVFYSPIKGDTGWSMAVVCSDKEIFRGLRQVGFNLLLLMLAGLALMGYIIVRSVRNFNKLQTVNAEKERIGSELRIANRIQMGMLPKIFPPYPDRNDVEIFASLIPAKEVGGDLYDFYIRDEKLFFCIGDVSGKGVPASLVMAVSRSLFRTVSGHETDPSRIVQHMNEAMTDMNETNMFVTLFVGVLDLKDGQLHYCNAGHCEPLLIGSEVEKLSTDTNIPAGVLGDWNYNAQTIDIKTQTAIFLYTDGLTEAKNAENDMFGNKRLLSVAEELTEDGISMPEQIIHHMSEAVESFVNGYEQSDDLTMLAIKYI